MSHMIDMSNGRANMAYVGEAPWHKLGAELQPGASIDEFRVAAGMGYEIIPAPVQYTNGELRTMPGKVVLYRSDTSAPLGVVSDSYKIVQPAQVLEFFRDLCERQDMTMETAGVLRGGAVYWALAKTGHTLNMGGGDITAGYCLMSTTADGTRATDNRFTSVRVVCNNTLSVATSSGRNAVRTTHRQQFDASAVRQKMGIATRDAEWNQFRANMETLAGKSVTRSEATDFFVDLLRPPKTARGNKSASEQAAGAEWLNALLDGQNVVAEMASERAVRGLADLEHSYYTAPGAQPGTAYGLVQGVTHYIDHVRGTDDGKRLTSAWFGQGETIKTRAMDAALAM